MSSLEERPPCAACTQLRRRCVPDCAFAPYFPPGDDAARFAAVRKVFGSSNASKLLAELAAEQRQDAVNSLVYEARARVRDPAFGCVTYFTVLQNMLKMARAQVAAAGAELAGYVGAEAAHEAFDPAEARTVGEAHAAQALAIAREQDDAMRAVREAAEVSRFGSTAAARYAAAGDHVSRRGKGEPQPDQQVAEPKKSAAAAKKAAREKKAMTRQAAAVEEQQQHAGAGLGFPDGRGQPHPNQQMTQQVAEAKKAAPVAARAKRRHVTVRWRGRRGSGEGDEEAAVQQQQLMVQHTAETRQWATAAEAARQHPWPAVQQEMLQPMAEAPHRHAAAAAEQYSETGLDVTLGHGHPHQQLAAAVEEQNVMMRQDATAAQQYQYPAAARHAGMGHGVPDAHEPVLEVLLLATSGEEENMITQQHLQMLERAREQQLVMMQQAAMAERAREQQRMMMQQAAAAARAREQERMMMQQAAAAERAREQELMMSMMQQQAGAAAGQQQQHRPVAQYADTELGFTLGHQPRQQTMQQLAADLEFAREQETMMMMQQAPAYAQAVPGIGAGSTVGFVAPESAEAAPFLVQQQPPSQAQTAAALGFQVDSSLPPLPAWLGQSHAQVSQQQHADGGDDGQSSDLMAYIGGLRDPSLPPEDGRSRW